MGLARLRSPGHWRDTCTSNARPFSEEIMLWTIFVILLVLWLLGLVSGYTLGGFVHILLVIAIVVVLIRVISGRRPV
jgi:DMSO reductase anchor subunit